jgi:hypothetical protein
MEKVEETVETGLTSRLQPWQSLFAIFTYALTQFDIGQTNTVILLGMILAALGFVQYSTYKHKEKIKSVVAPWLVEQLLKIISDYLAPELPPPPEEIEPPEETLPEPTKEELKEELKKRIAALEAMMRDG